MTRKKYNSRWSTDDNIKMFLEQKGLRFIGAERGTTIKVIYACQKGHTYKKQLTTLISDKVYPCNICDGNQYDEDKAREFISQHGFKLQEFRGGKDKYGNFIIPAAERLSLQCVNGHICVANISEIKKGYSCSYCKGTQGTWFSRSEEIIARVLDYASINYKRQYKVEYHNVSMAMDFYLPDLGIFIEYDGAHHVYGRSDSTDERNDNIKAKDKLRDEYAQSKDIPLHRIHHDNGGKALVFELRDILLPYDVYIDTKDPYYDTIVREVFDYCHEEFGWLSYDTIKKNADTYKQMSVEDASSLLDVHTTVLSLHFLWVYGVRKKYYGKIR